MTPASIELVIFPTRPRVSEAEFIAAVQQINHVIHRLPGYLHREIAYTSETGQWVDIVHWVDRESALAAAAEFGHVPGVRSFVGAIDFERSRISNLQPQCPTGHNRRAG